MTEKEKQDAIRLAGFDTAFRQFPNDSPTDVYRQIKGQEAFKTGDYDLMVELYDVYTAEFERLVAASCQRSTTQ